ncbi:MAG: glutamate racemase [Chitinophagales bacterium]
MKNEFPIGVFDSGYGGLTVLKEIVKELPQYDFIYLGDNARAPYGNRSFETVYEYTLECVNHLFNMGCRLVILACNTASAKALRTIQQNDLHKIDPSRRVLGVIRPTSEIVGTLTKTNEVGIFATSGTIHSESYLIEIKKFFPGVKVFQEACPMWVPLVENNEFDNPGADYFIQQHIHNLLTRSASIDAIILGCTHYPLLLKKIKKYLPDHINVIAQGDIIAKSLSDYLQRHPEMDKNCSKNSNLQFFTTDSTSLFDAQAEIFFGQKVRSVFLHL